MNRSERTGVSGVNILCVPAFATRTPGQEVMDWRHARSHSLAAMIVGCPAPESSQDRFSNSGSLAKMAAIRCTSSRVSSSLRRCR